jgi:hypothetical protein
MGACAKREMPIQIPMSSSAKADDPVRRAVSDLSRAGDYWIPAFAGMTAVGTLACVFVSCAFAARGEMLIGK